MRAALLGLTALILVACGPPRHVTHPPGVAIERDLVYATAGDHTLRFDLYRPEGADSPLPVVVWIHGGGWISGSHGFTPIGPLARRGYAIASIDYRLVAAGSPWPACLEDCRTAVRHLRAQGADLGLDPTRIGLIGVSAGGHLAALIATTAAADDPARPDAVVALCPITDLALAHDDPDSGWQTRYAIRRVLAGRPEQAADQVAAMDPRTHADPDDPPLLVVHGEADDVVPVAQGRLLAEGLAAAGVVTEAVFLPGVGHGNRMVGDERVQAAVDAFVDRYLGPPATTAAAD